MPNKTIPVEEVARRPRPGMAIPSQIAFSPDDTCLTCLDSDEDDLVQQLYSLDLESGERQLLVSPPGDTSEETLSSEEKLRRERQRQLARGVTRYAWARDAQRILIPLSDGIYVKDGIEAPLRRVVKVEGEPLLDPQISPDGEYIAYVRAGELYVVPATGGEPRQLTHGADEAGITHGLAEYVAQEEIDRRHGFWWSRDSQRLAFTEVDERHIPIYRIVHQGKDSVGDAAQEDHYYPFAGGPNARVRLGVVPVEGGEVAWMDLDADEDFYLARVQWWPDGNLTAQIENRAQTELRLLRLNPDTGESHTLLLESNDVWINLHNMLHPLKDGRFIWASERTGFMHLYLYDADGSLLRPLTAGEWVVDDLAGVDEEKGVVYFLANRTHPTERHLYTVTLEGDGLRRITGTVGTHHVILDHDRRRFVDVHSALHQPPRVTLRSLEDDEYLATIHDEKDPRIEELGLTPPEMVMVESHDGIPLYGLLYRPSTGNGEVPYPAIVHVYGGPHNQMVSNSWGPTADLRRQHLRDLGFAVFVLDNRGSARRGQAFEGAIRHNLGNVEVQDQVDGVRELVERGIADPRRVGIYGWSYGGYMTLMCLLHAPETFKVGVAGAPVTHWDGYDTHYTERYMSQPAANPAGYETSSVMEHVDRLQSKLLLVHGLIDENVHFRHTARLVNALIRARKSYDLLLFPDERHMPRFLADRIYMEERIWDFFLENL
ncbi:MAG: S9 family peptidase [Anaerolineae bacterium]